MDSRDKRRWEEASAFKRRTTHALRAQEIAMDREEETRGKREREKKKRRRGEEEKKRDFNLLQLHPGLHPRRRQACAGQE
jgi:hypothetical protein